MPALSYEVSQVEERGIARVYDLTVEEDHCFFAEGLTVHNCIDDPHKNLEEVNSETVMDNLKSVWINTADTRLEAPASDLSWTPAIVVNTTRWTPGDFVGWRMSEDGAFDHFTGLPFTDKNDKVAA